MLKTAFDYLFEMEQEMNDLYMSMGDPDVDENTMNARMEEAGTLQDLLTAHDFYMIDAKIDEVARALGLTDLGLDRDVTELSGGQRTKVLLAKLLLEQPEILLLDEPTIYLDREHIVWLQRYLQNYEKDFILISDDIPFLNSVINLIYHMENHMLDRFVGDYDEFMIVYEMRKAQHEAAYQKQQQEIADLYAREGVNPMSGCLWSFLPFPILIALYAIIRQPLSRFRMLSKDVVTEISTLATTLGYNAELVRKGYEEIGLAKFISDNFADFSGKFDGLLNVNYNFLGLDLTVMPGDVWKDFFTGGWPVIGVVLIPFISGALSFLQSKVSMAGNVAAEGNDAAARSSRMMMWMMPLMSLWIGITLPAALGVYWIVNSLLYAIQETVLPKYYKSHMEDELSEKEKQKRDDRLRRMEAAREQQRMIAVEEAEKKTLKEKRAEKQANKSNKKKNSTNENGRVGDRPYARGRSYDPEHYGE